MNIKFYLYYKFLLNKSKLKNINNIKIIKKKILIKYKKKNKIFIKNLQNKNLEIKKKIKKKINI